MSSPRSNPNPALYGWRVPEGLQQCTLWYRMWRLLVLVTFTLLWRLRAFNRHYEPDSGGVVYICNHQSFLDPMIATCMLKRQGNYMARESLFGIPCIGWLIGSVGAFAIRRGAADKSAIREAMRRLEAGSQVLVFAEGTRTIDGRISPLLPGVALLALKSARWVVPMVIDGAFEAWPKGQMFPEMGNIVVQYGKPISQAQAKKMKARKLLEHVREEMIDIQTQIRRRLGRAEIEYGR